MPRRYRGDQLGETGERDRFDLMLLHVDVGESDLGCVRDEEERKLHVGAQRGQCAHFIRSEVVRRAQQAGYAARLSELDQAHGFRGAEMPRVEHDIVGRDKIENRRQRIG